MAHFSYTIHDEIKCFRFASFSRYNRTKIRWSKNSLFLTKTKTIKISKKGALRVLDVTYRDGGVYACHAGLSVAELKLSVKPKPGDPPPTSEDYEDTDEYGKVFFFYFLLRYFIQNL